MYRKDFFKINKNKILITAVILVLFTINIFTGIFGGPHLNVVILLPIILFLILTVYTKGALAFIIVVISLIAEGVYLYFISCLSVSVYNKYLRKNK